MVKRNKKIEKRLKERENIHINYQAPIKPYHTKIAALVSKHAKANARVLDIGCGNGYILSEISKLQPSFRLVAADIDDNTLASTCKLVIIEDSIKIKTADDLFDQHGVYDAIVFSHVLEHTHRPYDTMKGLIGMLSPGGVIVVAVPNPCRFGSFYRNARQLHYVNRGHVCAWDRSHWINFLENIVGANVVEYASDFFPMQRLSNRLRFIKPLEIWLAKFLPWLSFSNIAVIKHCG